MALKRKKIGGVFPTPLDLFAAVFSKVDNSYLSRINQNSIALRPLYIIHLGVTLSPFEKRLLVMRHDNLGFDQDKFGYPHSSRFEEKQRSATSEVAVRTAVCETTRAIFQICRLLYPPGEEDYHQAKPSRSR